MAVPKYIQTHPLPSTPSRSSWGTQMLDIVSGALLATVYITINPELFPPPSAHSDSSTSIAAIGVMMATSATLGYFKDGEISTMDDFMRELLKDISITKWIIADVVSNINVQFMTIIQDNVISHSWPNVKIDMLFYNLAGDHKSLNENVIIVFYSNSKTLYDGRVIKITYIYWLGGIYKMLPLSTVVYNDMILQLFKHQATFKYDFKGNSTDPSDNNGDKVYGVAVFGKFNDISDSIISQWSKGKIFSVLALKTKLDEQIVYWLTENTSTMQDNNWGNEKFVKSYNHPSDGQAGTT
ncbi:hypothetical protein CPB84DRAFT_1750863 [Gymnopilus junonius]|uniref:Uncharacterized protein n=1 Tax=Gymnopilus junonius TaxID=109634 RepID=A0A9P5NGS4_GYMJU|nr:hypothetical protein CPB84DRAFT_1750863 [Gymnopilus junonius]